MQSVALILAAGTSKRLGASKPFVKLGKRTLLEQVVSTFKNHPRVGKVIVVCRKQDVKKVTRSLAVVGGKTRQESCRKGLQALVNLNVPLRTPILIHNVANPFVTKADIDAVLRAQKSFPAVALAQPVTDTVKEADAHSFVKKTLKRDMLWRTQTPQCMSLGLALKAHEKARRDTYTGTDDVELVERLGKRVKLIPCSERNFKITTPFSLEVAKKLFQANKLKN